MARDQRQSNPKNIDGENPIKKKKIRTVSFGRNYFYQLTDDVTTSDSTKDGSDQDKLTIDCPWGDALPISISCSVQSTIVVSQMGKVYQTGTMHGIVYPTWRPIEIPIPLRCVQVSAGRHFCLARMEGGRAVVAWGAGHFGQLGVVSMSYDSTLNDDSCSASSNGSNRSDKNKSGYATAESVKPKCITFTAKPIVIERLLPAFTGSPIQSIAAGDWHGLALTESGQVWSWGSNRSLQCGIQHSNVKECSSHSLGTIALPLPIPGLPPMKQITAGKSHSCSLSAGSGKVYCWGSSHSGQCGTGATMRRSVKGCTPSPVQGLPATLEMIQIAAAGNHCVCLSKAGRVFTWGDGREGQLGFAIASSTSKCISLQDHHSNKPRLISDLDFVTVAVNHGLRMNPNPKARSNEKIQSGNTPSATAAEILPNIPKISCVYASDNGSAAVCSSGHVYCWGSNDVGQLGIETPKNIAHEVSTEEILPDHEANIGNLTIDVKQGKQQLRVVHIETFDSCHNVLLPTRVKAVDRLYINLLAFGPNHMICFGSERDDIEESFMIGQTLHEAQVEQFQVKPTISVASNAHHDVSAETVDSTALTLKKHSLNTCQLTKDEIGETTASECNTDAVSISNVHLIDDSEGSSITANMAARCNNVEQTLSTNGRSPEKSLQTVSNNSDLIANGNIRKSPVEKHRPSLIKRLSNRIRRRRSRNDVDVVDM